MIFILENVLKILFQKYKYELYYQIFIKQNVNSIYRQKLDDDVKLSDVCIHYVSIIFAASIN